MAELRRARPLLGTFVEIQVEAAARTTGMAAIDQAFAVVQAVHERLSFHSPDSELTRLNQSPGQWQPLSPLGWRVLALARAMTRHSGERFNATVGGELVRLGHLPDHGGGCLPQGSAADIELRPGAARLRRPVRITLDGIAKGYAVDRAVLALKCAGVEQGVVNAGGDLRLFGHEAQPFLVRGPAGQVLAQGEGINLAIASSSGNAHHASRFPGYLVGSSEQRDNGWSVCARYAWRADALTKVAACAPAVSRAAEVERLGGLLISLAQEPTP